MHCKQQSSIICIAKHIYIYIYILSFSFGLLFHVIYIYTHVYIYIYIYIYCDFLLLCSTFYISKYIYIYTIWKGRERERDRRLWLTQCIYAFSGGCSSITALKGTPMQQSLPRLLSIAGQARWAELAERSTCKAPSMTVHVQGQCATPLPHTHVHTDACMHACTHMRAHLIDVW